MNATTRSGFLPDRTVHLHATRLCNLACRHCYSSSSPRARESLPPATLLPILAILREEGYETLSLSGGEPLMYAPLPALAARARDLGFRIVAISNGYRVQPRYDGLLACLDGVAISFDGLGAVHDRMRGRPGAYEVALDALRHLRARAIPAAAAYTVTRESLRDVPEFVELAVDCGVRAIQLRPLVMVGRAVEQCGDQVLDTAGLERLYLVGETLADAYRGEAVIHTDLEWSESVVADRAAYAALLDGDPAELPLADVVNPLVIAPDGTMKPFTYDFPPRYDLGSIEELGTGCTADFKTRRVAPLRGLVESVFAELATREEFIDWFAFCRDLGEMRGEPAASAQHASTG